MGFGHHPGQALQHPSPRVKGLVDPVAHAHDALLPSQLLPHPLPGPLGGADLPDHLHHRLVGPPVPGALREATAAVMAE